MTRKTRTNLGIVFTTFVIPLMCGCITYAIFTIKGFQEEKSLMKQYATKLTNRYDASVARRVTDDSIRIEDNELMNMDVPTEFTLDERRFFRDIMFDIDQAAGFGSYQTEIYPYEKYSIYTSNILTFLSKLGYHTDTSTNIVSWKEE